MHFDGRSQLVGRIVRDCRALGVEVFMIAGNTVEPDAQYGGAFQDSRLSVALGYKYWLETLVHEYIHVLQWHTGQWQDDSCWIDWDAWLAGKDFSAERVLYCCREIQACEMDAERRSTAMMRRYGIRMNYSRHIQSCNAYVLEYEFARRNRVIGARRHPKSLQALCSPIFMRPAHFGDLPEGYEALYRRRCL